jgi:para-nitrobenzyl esterase
VVTTPSGPVRGVSAGGVDSFLGIPYAAPPVGKLRWTAPRPAPHWSGIRPATAYGNTCPALASTNGPRSETEDCLFINVQRPTGTRPGRKLPVYVFIHGGGLINGSSTQMNMDKIVRESGVIGVTMNYRLGVFGFLGLPALTAAAGESGNYGFQDQQAALRWVRAAIGRFGGDPKQVTIGGESAGGWSVCAHLAAPGSRGLFAKAMIQSGSCLSITQPAAETNGTEFATAAGCPSVATGLSCLRALPTGKLLDAGSSFDARIVSGTPTLPVAPADAVRTGRFARVPVVIGANRDEGRTFSAGYIGWTQAQYTDWVTAGFGAEASAVLARYPWPASSEAFTAAYLIGAILTDSGSVAGIGGCSNRSLTRELAGYTRTYAYEFDHRSGPGLVDLNGYVWGAGHAAELAYLWPSFNNGTPIAPLFNAGERQLARDMVQYWGSFVKHGRPAAAGRAAWPAYNGTGRTLSLRAGGRSTTISDATIRAEHNCSFWAALA